VQRAMAETSDHLKILIEKPYLRPYLYDNKAWVEGDVASLNEVKAAPSKVQCPTSEIDVGSETGPQIISKLR